MVTPEDLLAIITIVGCMILMGFGQDGVIKSVFLTVVAYYFGRKTTRKQT